MVNFVRKRKPFICFKLSCRYPKTRHNKHKKKVKTDAFFLFRKTTKANINTIRVPMSVRKRFDKINLTVRKPNNSLYPLYIKKMGNMNKKSGRIFRNCFIF